MIIKRFSAALAVLTLALLPLPARAEPYADAEALYAAGHYDGAVAAARRIGSAEAHALAARALLSKVASTVPFDQRLPVLKEAEAEADAAIARNDRVIEGHLQKLVAYGYITRMPGFAGGGIAAARASRKILDRALALEPDNPWALAALGGWNLEVTRRAPLGLGGLMFGASRANGVKAFERALALAPGNVVIRYEYGLSLLWRDAARDRARADGVLGAAVALHSDDAYSRLLQARARRLLAEKDHRTLEALLAAYRGEAPEARDQTLIH